ncbi:hypothetical protein JCM10213v2_007514 [Rhodosporidiobolus nylandii]
MPPTPSGSRPSSTKPSSSSLSSIVSSLVRAQHGAAAPSRSDVPDDELDRHVAEMLLKEAKQKEGLWGERGTRAYFDPEKERRERVEDDRRRERSSRDAKGKGKEKERDLEEIFAEVEDEVRRTKRSRRSPSAPLPSGAPPPLPSEPLPSKMDKYFAPTYDPALDFTLEQVTDSSTGLIADGGLDAWSRMIDVVQARKEDKKDREAREKAERKAERARVRAERERKKKMRRGGSSSEGDEDDYVGPKVDAKTGLMDMSYARKGATREWDRGKEEPT